MSAATSPPAALPSTDWDAVRVPRQLGLAAMAILGVRAGAVVEDPTRAVLYFFTASGTASVWAAENTEALDGQAVPIPPARRTEGPGPHWRICPGDDRWITDASALGAALADAFGSPLGEDHG